MIELGEEVEQGKEVEQEGVEHQKKVEPGEGVGLRPGLVLNETDSGWPSRRPEADSGLPT